MKKPPDDSLMPARVVNKIAAELNLSKDEADALLSEFVSALRGEVRNSGEAIIPGVGSFQSVDGRLVFQADDDLQAAVNVRFDGLERLETSTRPVEPPDPTIHAPVGGVDEFYDEFDAELDEDVPVDVAAPDESDELHAVEADDQSSEDSADFADEANVDDESLEADERHDDPVKPDDDEADMVLPPFVPHTVGVPDDEPAFTRAEDESETPSSTLSTSTDTTPRRPLVPDEDLPYLPGDDSAPDDEYPLPPDPASLAGPSRRPQKNVTRAWIISSLIVLILIAAGIFFLVGDRDTDEFPSTFEGLSAVDNTDARQPAPTSTEAPLADDALQDAPPVEMEPEPPVEDPSPLYGDEIDTSVSNYTLFVASLPSEASANQVADQWRARGIRTAVFTESTNTGLLFRVGIGQFETIAMADSVRLHSDITPELPEGTWIRRYPATTAN